MPRPECTCNYGHCRYPFCPGSKNDLDKIEKLNPIEIQIKNIKYGFHGPLSISDLFLFFRIISVDVPLFPELEKNVDEAARFERAMSDWLPQILRNKE